MKAMQQFIPKPVKDIVVQIDLYRCHHDVAAHLYGDPGDVGVERH